MSTTINLPRDTSIVQIAAAIEAQNTLFSDYLTGLGYTKSLESWDAVKTVVRNGAASKYFKVGDQLQCKRGTDILTWDVIGFDHDTPVDTNLTHSMTLLLHTAYDSVQFDNYEAFYYAASAVLPAGTYNVTMGSSWGTNVVSGKSYQFTLANDLPIGGQLSGFEGCPDVAPSTWQVKAWASNTATTATETVSVTEGSTGTNLGTLKFGGDGTLNDLQRVGYGYNNWMKSAIRQYLNSASAAGSVWTPQHNFDRCPSWVSSKAGFLNGLDSDFQAVLAQVNKVTALNALTDGGGSSATNKELIFLLARGEVNGPSENSIDEGTPYQYFTQNRGDTGTGRNDNADSNRIKYNASGAVQWWWLRDPASSNATIARYISSTGYVSSSGAFDGGWAVPACVIA